MELNNQLLFFFSALGVFNGLLLSIYLMFFVKPKHIANQLLGLLMVMLCIRIGKSVFFYFMNDLAEIYRQIGLSACLFIGPALYLYILAAKQRLKHRNFIKGHFGLWLTLICSIGIVFPYANHPFFWNYYVIIFIYGQWLLYIVVTGLALSDTLKKAIFQLSQLNSLETWLLVLYAANVWICFSYNGAYYFKSPYILGPLSFSFLFYWFTFYLLFHKDRKTMLFGKYQKGKIQVSKAAELITKLDLVIKAQKRYKQPKLKLEQVAEEMGLTAHQLSQLLNDNVGKRFSEFINDYRIQEACEIIKSNTSLSLEGVGFEVGFSSKSTFYATFKKVMGTTPAKYKAQKSTPVL